MKGDLEVGYDRAVRLVRRVDLAELVEPRVGEPKVEEDLEDHLCTL